MKKKSKIILGIIGILILITVVIFLLIYFRIIYNPFINNRDLECSRSNINDKETFYFQFDWIGKIKEAEKMDYVYFETEDEAKEYYNYYISENFTNINIEEKTVIFNYNILGKQISVGTSRNMLLNDYEDFGFDCK